jgi:chromosome segregation ATPase
LQKEVGNLSRRKDQAEKQAAKVKSELEAKKQEAKELKKQVEEANVEITTLSSRTQELEDQVSNLSTQLRDVNAKSKSSIETEASALTLRIKTLEEQIVALEAKHSVEVQTAIDKLTVSWRASGLTTESENPKNLFSQPTTNSACRWILQSVLRPKSGKSKTKPG